MIQVIWFEEYTLIVIMDYYVIKERFIIFTYSFILSFDFFYLFVLRHIRHFFLIHIDFINCKTKVVGRTFWHMATYGAYTAVRDSGGSFPSIRF